MLTLAALCSEMEATDRKFTRRRARDWWTKGLLPRPSQRRLGRKGTETFWANPSILRQAFAAHDLLARHDRADVALLQLWLMGFPIDMQSVRAVYLDLNDRHLCGIREQAGALPEDVIGDLAAKLARRQVGKGRAPVEARDAYAALAIEFLSVFYGSEDDLMIEELAEYWEKAVPYVAGVRSHAGELANLHPTDETLTLWIQQLRQFVSLPAQRAAIESASDYELMRARRLIQFVLEYLRRISNAVGSEDACERFLVLSLTGRLLPVLVAVLREDKLRSIIMSSLLDMMLKMPPQAEWPALAAAAAGRAPSTVH
jgi:hypothetical protein